MERKIKLSISEKIPKKQTGESYTVENIVQKISEETKIPEDIVRRILIFVNFAIFTKDNSLTKFAETTGIKDYKELYEYLKGVKEDYKNDREIEAFSIKINLLGKSVYSRASAWIFDTFIKYENMEENQKYITSGLYAQSFFVRTFGHLMENLKILQQVFDKLEKDVVYKYVEEQNYVNDD